jgi:phosphoribosylformylglycinamidine synthase
VLWNVEAVVYLKNGVLDAPGQVVVESLHKLGFPEVKGARMGKAIKVELEAPDEAAARQKVQAMGEKLLCNPVVETFEIERVMETASA